ncbi:MAG TPA: tail fiber domain-containing protein [Alphaproteobacteria bacterium]|nr:tail fiber domain-containing protein [Alphaproteobacteria bacterium]
MAKKNFHSRRQGFTLLELVIVLGISGLIFAGLWGLIAGGNSQLQAQSAAQQYRQVIDATRKLLAPGVPIGSFDPDSFTPTSEPPTATDAQELDLTLLTDPAVGLLSPDFAQKAPSCATPCGSYFDAFGHLIHVKVQRQSMTSKQQWRFMVYSAPPSGVNGISDKTGAQVSALIGSEGGFVYNADTEGCLSGTAAANKACGSYNSFAIALADMGVDPGSGRIATLSFTNDSSLIGAPWLARLAYPHDTGLNTMQAEMDFKEGAGIRLLMRGNTIDMKEDETGTSGGGNLNMNGGQLNMLGGALSMGANAAATGGGSLYMGGGDINDVGANVKGANSTFTFSNLTLTLSNLTANSSTSIDLTAGSSVNVNTTSSDPTTVALSINGIGRADEFQAQRFIYQSDIRLKQNLHPIPNALDRILQVRGMNYEWRSNHAKDMGLVAQDVEKVFPEVVSTTGGTKGIDYAKMVAPLVEAIRQLKEDNDALRAKVNALEARLPAN